MTFGEFKAQKTAGKFEEFIIAKPTKKAAQFLQ